jgi:cytochrome c oxidase assembly protein subunit 19
LKCLRENGNDHFPCKNLSKEYLQCRMDRDLMAKDEMDNLGLGEHRSYERKPCEEGIKESKGFVAGLTVQGSKKWNWW